MPQTLIKWEGLDKQQATWKDIAAIQLAFPNFNLEDKVYFKGEGNLTNMATRGTKENKMRLNQVKMLQH